METSIISSELSDGSEVFDVIFIDGSQKVVINAEDEAGAIAIQEALAQYATGGQVDVATLAEVTARAMTTKQTQQHSPEPWAYTITARGGNTVIRTSGGSTLKEADENARRIVACVNACAGIGTDALEGSRGDLADRTAAENTRLRDDNKRLREALKAILAYEDDLPPQHSMGAEIYKQARAALAQSKSI